MKMLATLYTLIFGMNHIMMAQDISNYRWENRILLIICERADDPYVAKQLTAFREGSKDMLERKLEIILSTKDNVYIGLNLDKTKIELPQYATYKSTSLPFEMILIGLDGGIKMQYTEYTSLKEIFSLIDSMPMRKAEMRRKGY